MVVGVVEVVDVVVEGRGLEVVDIGNEDGGKWLSSDLLIFCVLAGYKHSAGVSAFVSTIFQYIMDYLENLYKVIQVNQNRFVVQELHKSIQRITTR